MDQHLVDEHNHATVNNLLIGLQRHKKLLHEATEQGNTERAAYLSRVIDNFHREIAATIWEA
jgi:hypothetical protein